jgi:hypothetical protein
VIVVSECESLQGNRDSSSISTASDLSIARNVCLLAPLRRPNPRATPGAIMGRFANSENRAMPVLAARSYQ